MADQKRPIRLRDALRLPAFTDNPPFDPAELEAFHEKCRSHKEAIGRSDECGCFHCVRIFHPSEIVRWVRSTADRADLTCAVCPHCNVDAVLPGAEVDLSPQLLQAMRDRWFRVAADQN